MSTGGGNLERPLGSLLPFDIREIDLVFLRLAENLVDIDLERLDAVSVLQKIYGTPQGFHRIDIQSVRHSCFAGVLLRNQ